MDRAGASANVWLDLVTLASNVGYPAHGLSIILRLVRKHQPELLEAWNDFFGAGFSQDELSVALMDGRTITVPLAWYPRLAVGTPEQRGRWEVAGGGYGIHWPELDEDLSTEGLLAGARAPRGSASWRSPLPT